MKLQWRTRTRVTASNLCDRSTVARNSITRENLLDFGTGTHKVGSGSVYHHFEEENPSSSIGLFLRPVAVRNHDPVQTRLRCSISRRIACALNQEPRNLDSPSRHETKRIEENVHCRSSLSIILSFLPASAKILLKPSPPSKIAATLLQLLTHVLHELHVLKDLRNSAWKAKLTQCFANKLSYA